MRLNLPTSLARSPLFIGVSEDWGEVSGIAYIFIGLRTFAGRPKKNCSLVREKIYPSYRET